MGNSGGWSMWLPANFTERGSQIDQLITVLHVFMAILFIGWGIFLVYCLVKFRARPGHKASYQLPKAKTSKYAEIGVAGFEAVLLLGFSMPIWAEVKDEIPEPSDAQTVRVIAQQFAWQFHYPGADGKFGKSHVELMDPATNPVGLDRENDPDAADDIWATNLLSVPVDQNIRVELMSRDVIHSFYVPVLRVKQDVIPGMKITTWFRVEPDAAGQSHDVQCAQLCGLGHGTMRGKIMFQTAAQHQAWLDEQASYQIPSEDDWGDDEDW